MLTFDHILQGHEATLENAKDHARGLDWGGVECSEQSKPTHSRFEETVNGIDIYYDFGADYYFFVDAQ
tara:strand:- start:27 stop:230 length:204 start_codon:yes stop_codon:yes gene_type:complete